MPNADFTQLIAKEYTFFENAAQRAAFARSSVTPERVLQAWAYSATTHECYVVARTSSKQIVYCATGFGPASPWSVQPVGETDLGMDGMWHAYLYECIVGTEIWPPVPADFRLMGPGERQPNRETDT